MKMYIANCTQQNQVVFYRVPEIPSPRQQHIAIGQQMQISGDLNQKQADSIIEQLRPYGMVSVDEVDRTKPFIGMCYSLDKPVKIDIIMRAVQHNALVLTERGKRLRQEAAVAVSQQIEQQLQGTPGSLTNLEIEVAEVPPKDGSSSGDFSEGLRVTRNEEPGAIVPKGRGRGKKQ